MAEKITTMTYFFNNLSNKLDKLSYSIKTNPYNAKFYAERAYLYYNQNEFGLASKDCQQAMVLDPTNQEYKELWNNITLKSMNFYNNLEVYKMQIKYLLQ